MTYSVNGITVIDINKNATFTSANVVSTVGLAIATEGFQGEVSGYTSGGLITTPAVSGANVIDKFPFATNGNATDVGDLTRIVAYAAGQSSTVSGYTSGGVAGPLNTIDKFPFASGGNATDVGDLTVARNYVTGQSSTVSGYSSGGLS